MTKSKSIISAIIAISASSILAQTPTLTLIKSNIQHQYEIMSNPVVDEEGITTSDEISRYGNTSYSGEIQITGKVAKIDTVTITVAYDEPEMKPLISNEEIAQMNADAAKYHAKRLARAPKIPTTLFDSCLVSAESYFPNDHAAAMKYAEETYKIIMTHSNVKNLAAHYTAENNKIKTAYSEAGRVQPSSKRTFN